jgi:hypothetical protein
VVVWARRQTFPPNGQRDILGSPGRILGMRGHRVETAFRSDEADTTPPAERYPWAFLALV